MVNMQYILCQIHFKWQKGKPISHKCTQKEPLLIPVTFKFQQLYVHTFSFLCTHILVLLRTWGTCTRRGVVTEKHLGFCKTNCDKVILVALMVIPTGEVGVLFLPAHTAGNFNLVLSRALFYHTKGSILIQTLCKVI